MVGMVAMKEPQIKKAMALMIALYIEMWMEWPSGLITVMEKKEGKPERFRQP